MQSTDRIFVSDAVSFELVGGLALLIVNDSGEVLTCNETMTALLTELDGTLSIGDVAHRLQERFEGEAGKMAKDLLSAASQLSDMGVLDRV